MSADKYGIEEGALPLAVGTSLAIESLVKSNIKDKIGYLDINVGTLVRNWLGATSYVGEFIPLVVFQALWKEMNFITSYVKSYGMIVSYYYSDLTSFYVSDLWKPYMRSLSEKEQFGMVMANKFMTYTNKELQKKGGEQLTIYPKRFYVPGKRNLVLSHNNLDYLGSTTSLLESHTGSIKPNNELYTKYAKATLKGKADTRVERAPYCKELVLVFGTRNLFKVKDLKLREMVFDILVEKKVHPLLNNRLLNIILSDQRIKSSITSLPTFQ